MLRGPKKQRLYGDEGSLSCSMPRYLKAYGYGRLALSLIKGGRASDLELDMKQTTSDFCVHTVEGFLCVIHSAKLRA